jgi:hypothetical protein
MVTARVPISLSLSVFLKTSTMLRSILQHHQVRSIVSRPTHYRAISTTLSQASQETSGTTDNTSSTDEVASTNVDTAAAEEPLKLSRRRRRFHEWVRGSGSRYARPSEGTTNYLGETVIV